MNDIIGMRFGKLSVVGPTGEKSENNGIIWRCKCDCGNFKDVPQNYLIEGSTKSCGCLNKEKAKDLTGEHHNMLTVIRRADKPARNGAVIWECKCDCGNSEYVYVTSSNLINGKVKSCGCLRGGKPPKDLTGQTFGILTVLRPTDQRSGSNIVWECKCECGNIVKRSTAVLRNGGVKSCGCLTKQDITGKRFGKLVALRPTKDRTPHRYVIWECQCDCGNTVLVDVNSLRNNRTKSCGCLKRGKMEVPTDERQIKQPLKIQFKLDKSSHQDDFYQEVIANTALWSTSNELAAKNLEQVYIDRPEPPQKHIESNGSFIHSRDENKAWIALEHAGHKCEINSNHPTFISKRKNLPYTEPHHLIPLAFSECERFKNLSLDVPANIVSLCSNCHNHLHYGKDIKQILKDLYKNRKARLVKAGLNITFEELLSMYNVNID